MSKPSLKTDGTRAAPSQRTRVLRQKDFALQPAVSFLGLPQELRDHIYSYLPLKTKKLIHLGSVSSKKRPRAWRTYKRLSRVCSRVRAEVSNIFWAKNAFVANVGPKLPLLTAETMFWMTRLALRTAPYYFRPRNGPYGSRIRYEGILLLSKRGDEWKVMIDVEKQRILQSLRGGYRVNIDRDTDFDSPGGLVELETQRRIVDDAMPIVEEVTYMLQDNGCISRGVLAGTYWCLKQHTDVRMLVKQPNNRLCI